MFKGNSQDDISQTDVKKLKEQIKHKDGNDNFTHSQGRW